MLLALGPVQLDAAEAVIVAGIADAGDLAGLRQTAASCDLLWLRGAVTPEHVVAALGVVGVPVGVDADDADDLVELARAGAVAAEVRSSSPVAMAAALERGVTLWCAPVDAKRAAAAGLRPSSIVVEGGVGPGVPGSTEAVEGPAGWGAVFEAVASGARVVRTTDVRSVRRVVTVTDRLRAARRADDRTVTT